MAGPIKIAILANGTQARSELSKTAATADRVGGKVSSMGRVAATAAAAGLAVAGAAAVKFGADAVQSASRAQQSIGATETVFGKYADTVIRRSNDAARSIGLSANEYRELSNVVGASLKGAGVPIEKVTGLTDKLNTRAADLAATFGGSTREAVESIGSLLRGEADPIEQYGVSIKQSDVNARLAAKGLSGLTGASLKQAEMQARLDLLFQKTRDSSGAFGRESGTLAHQQQVLAAQFENIKAKVGTALLPVLTKLLTYVNDTVLPGFSRWREYLSRIAVAVAPVVAFVRRLFASFNGSSEAGTKLHELQATVAEVWAAIRSIFRSAVEIVQTLWRAFGSTIVRYARATFSNMIQIIRGAFRVIKGIFNVVAGVLKGDWSRVWTGIKQIVSGAWMAIKAVVRQGWNVIRTVFSAAGTALRGIWSRVWSGIRTLVSTAWGGIRRAVATGVAGMLTVVRGIPGRISGALGNLGSLLYSAGKSVVQGLIDGIRSMIGKVADVAGSVAGVVKDFFPGSPVKKGPLRAWNHGAGASGAGRRLMEGLAEGIDGSRSRVSRSLTGVTGMIADSLQQRHTATIGVDVARRRVDRASSLDVGFAAATALRGDGGRPSTININVTAPVGSASADIGRVVVQHLDAYLTAGGRSQVLAVKRR